MGGKTSKISGAAGSAARKYPTAPRSFPSSQTTTSGGGASSISAGAVPSVHPPPPYAAFEKSDKIRQDAEDPDFANMLKTVGAVQIQEAARNFDLSRVKNPQLQTLQFRKSISNAQEEEISDPRKRAVRSWVGVGQIREILSLRDAHGWPPEKIEKRLGLAPGLVERLGEHVRNA
ncbi:hypothetical protein FN846DRAFT_956140 [Sphaerosporella brunnea]|uniref:Helix-turn-helix domain-containing protein n=1 Tax=Sphaerosporella brunnea TaxID=1250544 RepID=A0A5J5ESS8_9PEZI|nr:hypothetical protein FN846DRAFT_956140 [Sphaerosporella brunnea]